jgi:hypothetical protein
MSGKEQPIEIINPPNMLKVKVGGKLPATDPAAVQRAEQALEALSSEFRGWLAEEVTKLEAAWAAARKAGLVGDAGEALFTVAHDLRGLGTTYEFPIISRMSASLSRLIEDDEKRAEMPVSLVDAHVNAIVAALRQNIRSEENPVGKALADELEQQVIALVGEPN